MKDDNLDVMDHSTHGAPESIIFIDTENTFRANRVYQIAEQKNLDPEDISKREYIIVRCIRSGTIRSSN